MKRTFLYILAALLAASCKNSSVQNNKSEGDKPVITVTIEPLRYFTEAIAGDNFNVISMVPKGSSPETYDPMPMNLTPTIPSKTMSISIFWVWNRTFGVLPIMHRLLPEIS